VTLAGTLTLPSGAGTHPGVVLITGSGPQNRDEALMGHRPFLVLADHLTRQGIAVLRCDDRGIAKSTGDFSKATHSDFVEDALAALSWLKTGRRSIHGERDSSGIARAVSSRRWQRRRGREKLPSSCCSQAWE
jgi:alpha/beta superfamily hydrolase